MEKVSLVFFVGVGIGVLTGWFTAYYTNKKKSVVHKLSEVIAQVRGSVSEKNGKFIYSGSSPEQIEVMANELIATSNTLKGIEKH